MKSIVAAIILSVLTGQAFAQAEPRSAGPFGLDESRPGQVTIEGSIEDGAALNFVGALRKRPDITTVLLNSDGGYVEQALLIANAIRERGLDTYVPAGAACYSACAYIYFAGANRRAVGELGVHQVSGDDLDPIDTQIIVSDVLDALAEYGVAQGIVSLMLRTPPDSMHVFSPGEIVTLGIDETTNRDFAELDRLYPPPRRVSPVAAPVAGCRAIESHIVALSACLAHDWLETPGTGAQEFVFGTADDAYGLMVVTESEFFTQQEFRDAIIQNAVSGADRADDVEVLSERHASIAGKEFDVIVYSVLIDGLQLMFQNNYYSDPDFGSLQIIAYSVVKDSFAAAIRLQSFLASVELGDTAPTPGPEALPAPPAPSGPEQPRRMDQQGALDLGL